MHQLAYDLPERTGFGGMWASTDDSELAPDTVGDVECEPELVASSVGATSPQTRITVAAFRRSCCNIAAA